MPLDGSVHGNFTSGSSLPLTLTTTAAGVVVVACTNNGPAISSISSSNTTGWTQRASQGSFLELWYGVSAGPLTNEVITVTLGGSTSFTTLDIFGISGADTVSIFDPNVALPASNSGSAPITTTITTTNANDFLISILRGSDASPTAAAGWTPVSGADYQLVQYKVVAATQSGLSVGAGSSNENRIIADAILLTSVTAGSAGFQGTGFQPNAFQEGSFFNPQLVTPGMLALALTPFTPTVLNPQSATPGTLALVITPFVPTVLAYHNQSGFQTAFQGDAFQVGWQFSFVGAVPVTLALTMTPFVATVAATANQFVTPGTKSLVLTPFVPTVAKTSNVFVTPGTLALVLTKYAPTVVATGSRTAKNYGSGSEVMPQGKFKWSKAWEQKFAEDRMLAARERSKARFEDFDAFVLEQWREQEDSDLQLAAAWLS